MLEHIMRAEMRYSERVVVQDAGQKIPEGTPEQLITDPAVERAYLGE
jgi:branched-chain amino acid transport system ATP-binding protein